MLGWAGSIDSTVMDLSSDLEIRKVGRIHGVCYRRSILKTYHSYYAAENALNSNREFFEKVASKLPPVN